MAALPAVVVAAVAEEPSGSAAAAVPAPAVAEAVPVPAKVPSDESLDEVQKVWEIDARPFGDGVVVSGGATLNLRFPGQYADQESGLHQNGHRDYSPAIGRYLQRDPLLDLSLFHYAGRHYGPNVEALISEEPSGLADGVNVYAYVHNNPLIAVDTDGLAPQICVGVVIDKSPTLPKPNSLYGYCRLLASCFSCPADPDDPTIRMVKVWVPWYARCPEKCGFVTSGGKGKPDMKPDQPSGVPNMPGLTLCTFPVG